MDYKLIAVDMDGTFLNSEKKISAKNEKAMRDCLAAGKIFTVSTGRPLPGVTHIVDMIDADLPFIVYDGAMVVTTKSNRVLYENMLSGELAAEVVRQGNARETTVFVWSGGDMYVSSLNKHVELYSTLLNDVKPNIVDNLEEIAKNGATKVVWRDEPTKISQFKEELNPLFTGKLNCHLSDPNLLEFVDINVSKAAALQKICEHFGIKREKTIAVGDNFNDISMIDYAGLGCAMDNAPQEVKNIADYVTLSNDEDGVAEVICKFLVTQE